MMVSILDYDDKLKSTTVASLMGCLKEFILGAELTSKYDLDSYDLPERWTNIIAETKVHEEIDEIIKEYQHELAEMIRSEVGFVHLYELKSLINPLMRALAKYMLYEPDPEKFRALIKKYDERIQAAREGRDVKPQETIAEDNAVCSDVVHEVAATESEIARDSEVFIPKDDVLPDDFFCIHE